MSNVAAAIDATPLAQLLTDCVMSAPGAALNLTGAALGEIANLGKSLAYCASDNLSFGSGDSSALSPPSDPQVTTSLSRAVETPQLSTEYCVSMAELGNFSPCAVGGDTGRSAGIGGIA